MTAAFTEEQKSAMRKLANNGLSEDECNKLEFYLLMSSSSKPSLQLAGKTAVLHLLKKMQQHYQTQVQQEADAQRISVQ